MGKYSGEAKLLLLSRNKGAIIGPFRHCFFLPAFPRAKIGCRKGFRTGLPKIGLGGGGMEGGLKIRYLLVTFFCGFIPRRTLRSTALGISPNPPPSFIRRQKPLKLNHPPSPTSCTVSPTTKVEENPVGQQSIGPPPPFPPGRESPDRKQRMERSKGFSSSSSFTSSAALGGEERRRALMEEENNLGRRKGGRGTEYTEERERKKEKTRRRRGGPLLLLPLLYPL